MPDSCSYKLIHNGLDLPDWHPLIKGLKTSTHETGNSVAGRVIPETDLENEDDLLDHITDWDEALID